MIVFALVATIGSCPFPPDHWTAIPTKRQLPPTAAAAFGEMADEGQPFQETDVLPLGPRLPFSRFVSAQGRGCELVLDYEHGGRAHSRRTAHMRFDAGHWIIVDR